MKVDVGRQFLDVLATPLLADRVLGHFNFIKLPRGSSLVALVFIWVIFPHKSFELFFEPSALDTFVSVLQVNRKLQNLGMVPLWWHTVGISGIFVKSIVLLAPIPHFLLVHGLLQLVLQFSLLLPIIVWDQIKRSTKILDGIVIVHIQKKCFCSHQERFPARVCRNVVTTQSQFNSGVAILERFFVFPHPAQDGTLFQLNLAAEQGRVNIEAPHGSQTVIHMD